MKCPNKTYTLPTNGYEPERELYVWNNNKTISKHNCYAYVADDIMAGIDTKPQPGKRYYIDKSKFHKTFKNYHEYQSYNDNSNYEFHKKMLTYHGEMESSALMNQTMNNINCDNVLKRIQLDIPNLKLVSKNDTCPNDHYKGYVAVHEGKDYHFWRQDQDGTWSHKPGGNYAVTTDADGCNIVNPSVSNRNFGRLNYKHECSYFCIPIDTKII